MPGTHPVGVCHVPDQDSGGGVGRDGGGRVDSAGAGGGCCTNRGVAVTWGANGWGQLGDSSTTYRRCRWWWTGPGCWRVRRSPRSAPGTGACAVAARRAHCWGGNDPGELGLTVSVVPVAVDASGVLAGKTVTAITAGDYYTCAVADGQTFCWGRNKQQRRDEVEGAGSGEHRRAAAPYIGHRDHAGGGHTAAIAVPMTSVPKPPTATTGIKAAVKKRPVKITWKPVTAATSYRVRDLQTGREEIQALEDHQHPGVQNQSPQRQEIPLPSRRSRSRWTRTGHHQTVQNAGQSTEADPGSPPGADSPEYLVQRTLSPQTHTVSPWHSEDARRTETVQPSRNTDLTRGNAEKGGGSG